MTINTNHPHNEVPRHQIERACQVINEVLLPFIPAALVDCVCCLEDEGLPNDDYGLYILVQPTHTMVDGQNLDADRVAADATVYGALPRGTQLNPVSSTLLRLVKQVTR